MPMVKRLSFRAVAHVFVDAGREWLAHKCPRLGASLAFYAILSLAPLAVISVGLLSMIVGGEVARGEVTDQMREVVGEEAAQIVSSVVANTRKSTNGFIATTIGIITLVVGAMAVFVELQDALNTIWEVPPHRTTGWWRFIKDRFLSFFMIFGIGLLVLTSIVLSLIVTSLGKVATDIVPATQSLLQFSDPSINFVVFVLLFAGVFRWLPDVSLTWRDTALGAVVTAILFLLGKIAISFYLHQSGVGNAYGAAGSIVVFLVWMYYSMQVLLFGAELTRSFSLNLGSGAVVGGERIPRRGSETESMPAVSSPS
ncbi:ribonuclease BN/unknown domain fusion protein [Planctopirus ephydatiae]|uniref:Uncharacterized protein n=1 Tax=Planctopirus ephydatiae TaxID=2528019 RepID=A0A518GS26_9PLAN|nr:YihY/virulence factor BrkB family protein [Planctopirus ephydatiae]QDV31361.1 ribonuclease BN/unknown domain fusion protein [Planctopirus ephydatiae]